MRFLLPIAVLLCSACAGPASDANTDLDSARTEGPELWSLSTEPLVSIGVVEGEEPYQLHSATSSLRLDDGRLVVVNGGSSEVRIFDAQGAYLGAFGQNGDGPGEFRRPSRVSLTDDGGLRIWDARLGRFSFHDTDGTHRRVQRMDRTSEEAFPGDVWVYRRNLVDSPVAPSVRGALVPGLDALPPVDSLIPVRYVELTEQGRFWAHDEPSPAESPVAVSVYSLEGSLVASITIPAHFEPHDIGPDYVLGRRFDDLDVNYIEHYTLEKPDGSSPGGGLGDVRAAAASQVVYATAEVPDEIWPEINSTLKQMASRQEINYSKNMSYTMDLVALELQPAEDMRVDFLQAGPRGWSGIITHTPTGAYCVLAYGLNVPMGWQGGALICPGR